MRQGQSFGLRLDRGPLSEVAWQDHPTPADQQGHFAYDFHSRMTVKIVFVVV
jgi:hypothetical protein